MSLSGRNMPTKINIRLIKNAQTRAWKKYPSVPELLPCLSITKRIAEPTPIMAPMANIRLYIGRTRFRAVMPFAPTDWEIKNVSARIYTDIPTMASIF